MPREWMNERGEEPTSATNAGKKKTEELGVDLSRVRATGSGDRLTLREVRRAAQESREEDDALLGPHVRSSRCGRELIGRNVILPIFQNGARIRVPHNLGGGPYRLNRRAHSLNPRG
jgi:pyruvate/2-oxoglutarate dehydrogenase complex dihydrolipoamide acyltransferase (E2) component